MSFCEVSSKIDAAASKSASLKKEAGMSDVAGNALKEVHGTFSSPAPLKPRTSGDWLRVRAGTPGSPVFGVSPCTGAKHQGRARELG